MLLMLLAIAFCVVETLLIEHTRRNELNVGAVLAIQVVSTLIIFVALVISRYIAGV